MAELVHLSQRVAQGTDDAQAGMALPPPRATGAYGELASKQALPTRLRVEWTTEWEQQAATRVGDMLGHALPPLCAYGRPAVREALAECEYWV